MPNIPQRMHIEDAKSAGYTVDTYCHPPLAYKGPRFKPDDRFHCYTELESELIRELETQRKAALHIVRCIVIGKGLDRADFPEDMKGSLAQSQWDTPLFGYGMEYGALHVLMKVFGLTSQEIYTQ